MRILKPFFLLFILISLNAKAQEVDFTEEVSEYLDRNGSMNQYQYAYDELLKMFEKQYPKSENTANGWEYLEGYREKAINEMKVGLIPIYKQNFTQGDIEAMNTFYQSDTGKQLVADRSQMTETQKQELNTFYNSKVGKKIIEKQPILTTEISKVSENWSRDLYETAKSLLNN